MEVVINKQNRLGIFNCEKFSFAITKQDYMTFSDGTSGITIFYQIDNKTKKDLNLQMNEKYLITQNGEQRDEDSHLSGYVFDGGKIVAQSYKVGTSIFLSTTCGKLIRGCKYSITIQDESDYSEYSILFEYDGLDWNIINVDVHDETDIEEDKEDIVIKQFDTKFLVANTEIIESTFTNNNLKLLGIGFTVGDFELLTNIEVTILNGNRLENDVRLKINFYNEDNEIVCSSSSLIKKDKFSGYDTFVIESSDDDYYQNKSLLKKIKRARVFAAMENN